MKETVNCTKRLAISRARARGQAGFLLVPLFAIQKGRSFPSLARYVNPARCFPTETQPTCSGGIAVKDGLSPWAQASQFAVVMGGSFAPK